MCGSGTIAIEAFLWSRSVAPGLSRAQLGAERWASFGESERHTVAALRDELRGRARADGPEVFASDVDPEALAVARSNAGKAGARLSIERRSVADLAPLSPPGFVVTNPPYGERLEATRELYASMGRAFSRLGGHTIAVLAGTPAIARAIPMRPVRAHAVFNGDIECRLLTYSPR
jgi:putative N6-adenine-specific DNA methylase